MKLKLLTIAGVIQVLFVLLHLSIIYSITQNPNLDADTKIMAQIFNAAVTITVIFFAFVSLLRRHDMLNTNFGRIVSGFIALFYFQRVVVEAFLREINLALSGIILLVAVLYAIVAFPSKKAI